MRSPQWLSRKNKNPLAALYSALWWGSCALLCLGIAAAIASADLQDAQAATVQSISKRSPAADIDRHGAPGEFPQPAIFHKCGALNGFFLRPGRKPGPYNALAPAALATRLYLEDDRERHLLSPIALWEVVGRRGIYLYCCSFLI